MHGRTRPGAAADNPPGGPASAPVQVDWAGLPINLDLVFSREQRDKVYVQHLMRKRGAQLWRWLHDGAPPCICDIAADYRQLDPGAAEFMSSR
ncbi:hypothetical protein [Mycobacterium lacus]|uniref:hypothetical protein n=1 Tax=Mycobacterium lacus TaxID=169765 RepID=UPI001E58DA1A|nr:hypothetical protein [Mycobacterium lacus]